MENQFIPYELAVKLKELGFDEPCLTSYRFWQNPTKIEPDLQHNIPTGTYTRWSPIPFYGKYSHRSKDIVKAPLWQQAFDWFRVEKDLYPDIYRTGKLFSANLEDMLMGNTLCEVVKEATYEEARLACLEKLIEIVENEKSK